MVWQQPCHWTITLALIFLRWKVNTGASKFERPCTHLFFFKAFIALHGWSCRKTWTITTVLRYLKGSEMRNDLRWSNPWNGADNNMMTATITSSKILKEAGFGRRNQSWRCLNIPMARSSNAILEHMEARIQKVNPSRRPSSLHPTIPCSWSFWPRSWAPSSLLCAFPWKAKRLPCHNIIPWV